MKILENVKIIDLNDRVIAIYNDRHFVYLKDDFNEKTLCKDLAKYLLEDLMNLLINI